MKFKKGFFALFVAANFVFMQAFLPSMAAEISPATLNSGDNLGYTTSDTWTSTITNQGGNFFMVGTTHNTSDGIYSQISGMMQLVDSSSGLTIDSSDSSISGGSVNFTSGGFLTVTSSGGSITNTAISLMGGASLTLENQTVNTVTLAIDSTANIISIGDGTNATTLTLLNGTGTINSQSDVTIQSGSTLNINGGITYLDANDTWTGTVNLSNGAILNYDDLTSNGTLVASVGTLNIGSSSAATLNIAAGSSIAQAINTNLASGSTLNISGGTVDLNALDVWSGNINLSDGTLNLSSGIAHTTSSTSTYNQSGGALNIDGISPSVTMANGGGSITGGEVNLTNSGSLILQNQTTNTAKITTDNTANVLTIGDGASATTLNLSSGSSITSDSIVTLAANSVLNITNTTTTVNLNSNDSWAGTINLNNAGATLNYDGLTSNGTLVASAGTLNIGSSSAATLNIATGSSIAQDVTTSLASGSTLDISGGTVTLDNADTWAGAVQMSTGSFTLTGRDDSTDTAQTYNQTGGSLTLTSSNLDMSADINSSIIAGNLTTSGTSVLTLNSVSTVGANAGENINIGLGTTVNIAGGTLAFDDSTNDSWLGNITNNIVNGILNIKDAFTHTTSATSTYNQSAGILNIEGTGSSLTMANGGGSITGGDINLTNTGSLILQNETTNTAKITTDNTANILTLGDGINATTLTLSSGSDISYETAVTVEEASILNNGAGSTVNLSAATSAVDTWNGTINNNGGTINLDDMVKTAISAIFKQDTAGSITNITGDTNVFDLNNAQDSISLGNLNIGTSALTSGTMAVSAGTVASTATVTLYEDSILDISSTGTVTLNGTGVDADTWDGDINVSGGTLNLTDSLLHTTTAASTYTQTGGILNLESSAGLILDEVGSYIAGGTVNVQGAAGIEALLTIQNGLTTNSAITNVLAANTLTIDNLGGSASGSYTAYTTVGGTIVKDAVVNILNTSILNVAGDGIAVGSDTSALVTLDSNTDTWDGGINVSGGDLILDNMVKTVDNTAATGPYFNQSGGTTVLENGTVLDFVDAGYISGGSLILDNTSEIHHLTGSMTTDGTNNPSGDTGDVLTSGLIDSMNDQMVMSNHQIGGNFLVINSSYLDPAGNPIVGDAQADFKIDVYGRSIATGGSDKYTIAGGIEATDGLSNATIHIADWNLLGDVFGKDAPIDRYIPISVFNASSYASNVMFGSTDKEIKTPIGYYALNSSGSGQYGLELMRYNPEVFRGQVATVAQYANQIYIGNMLFDHVDLVNQRELIAQGDANKHAAEIPQFAPYQYNKEDGGVWVKSYGIFENINMSEHFDVRNYAYGALIGADLPQKELGKGWKVLTTLYVAYNGGHQTYDGIGMYQNGGQGGIMGTFTKGNFLTSLLAYGGGYGNIMHIDQINTQDTTGNWFAGVASKSAYNFKLPWDLYLQPNFMVMYNAFGKQNWSTQYGEMTMASGMLNGLNVAPGLNLIWNKKTFSIYATTQLVFNILGGTDGHAGNVDLPSLRMNNTYFEYGLGFKKSFTDRFSAYLQATARAGARLGGAVQGGLEWRF